MELLFTHLLAIAPKVFDTQSDPSDSYCVEFFDPIIIFSVLIFKKFGHQPEPIDRFFLSIVSDRMIQEVTILVLIQIGEIHSIQSIVVISEVLALKNYGVRILATDLAYLFRSQGHLSDVRGLVIE